MKENEHGLVFSTGKVINEKISLSDLDGECFINYGYDGEMSVSDFTKEEKIELADHMIGLWNKFKPETEKNIQELINSINEMKRAHLEWAEYFEANPDIEKQYVATGEWADAKKHRDYVNQYDKILNILNSLEAESIKCDCEERMLNIQQKIRTGDIPNNPMFKFWICPAHGYKKL